MPEEKESARSGDGCDEAESGKLTVNDVTVACLSTSSEFSAERHSFCGSVHSVVASSSRKVGTAHQPCGIVELRCVSGAPTPVFLFLMAPWRCCFQQLLQSRIRDKSIFHVRVFGVRFVTSNVLSEATARLEFEADANCHARAYIQLLTNVSRICGSDGHIVTVAIAKANERKRIDAMMLRSPRSSVSPLSSKRKNASETSAVSKPPAAARESDESKAGHSAAIEKKSRKRSLSEAIADDRSDKDKTEMENSVESHLETDREISAFYAMKAAEAKRRRLEKARMASSSSSPTKKKMPPLSEHSSAVALASKIETPNISEEPRVAEITALKHRYLPIGELMQATASTTFAFYGFVSFVGAVKQTRGRHRCMRQLRIRDATVARHPSDDGLQVMSFANKSKYLPNPDIGDVLRLHRAATQPYGGYLQCLLQFNDTPKDPSFVVVYATGCNLLPPRCIKQVSHHKNYSWFQRVDPFIVFHLRQVAERWFAMASGSSPRRLPAAGVDSCKRVTAMAEASISNLADLTLVKKRDNVVVMVVAMSSVESECGGSEESHSMRWLIWDGTKCALLFDWRESAESTQHIVKMRPAVGGFYQLTLRSKNAAKLKKLTESKECRVTVGSWVRLYQVLVVSNGGGIELVADDSSSVWPLSASADRFVRNRLDFVHKVLAENRVATRMTHSGHPFQGFTPIGALKSNAALNFMYKVRVRMVGFSPQNVDEFSVEDNGKRKLLFLMRVSDCSDALTVVVKGHNAEKFFGVSTDEFDNDSETRKGIAKKLTFLVQSSKCIMDICVRSYRVRHKGILAHKLFDTVLLK